MSDRVRLRPSCGESVGDFEPPFSFPGLRAPSESSQGNDLSSVAASDLDVGVSEGSRRAGFNTCVVYVRASESE
jgi:hypothetical protein